MWLDKLAPKKFLCKYSLKCGSKTVGVFMIVLMIICIIGSIMQVVNLGTCRDCAGYTSHIAYAYCITAVIYSFAMLILTIWFLCGVKKQKSSVILGYTVICGLSLIMCFCMLIVLTCLIYKEVTMIYWVLSLIFELIFLAVLFYFLLVVYAYWKQTKLSFISNAIGS